jgi:uncharacterized protein YjiK
MNDIFGAQFTENEHSLLVLGFEDWVFVSAG